VKSVREYYVQCLETEVPTFIKVMKAIPPDQAAYRPHPRSTTAGDLAWLLAAELHDACELIDPRGGELRPEIISRCGGIDCSIREECRGAEGPGCGFG
jgi:hypothetical protein